MLETKTIYKAPIVEICYVNIEGMIAASTPRISVGVEDMENITLGDDGYGNNDILLNF